MKYLAFLLGVLLASSAWAQQVPNPLPAPGGPQYQTRFGYLHVESPATVMDDLTDVYVYRDANYAGGTHGTVNTSAAFNTTVRAGTIPHEWNLYAGLDNYARNTDGSENTGFYSQAHKRSTGFTWAGVMEVRDYSLVAPSLPAIALELNVVGPPGPDITAGRVGLNLWHCGLDCGAPAAINMRSDVLMDGAYMARLQGVEMTGAANYWYNLLATTDSAKYLYGVNLGYGVCDTTLPGTPGAQFIGPNYQIDCFGNLVVSNEKTINAVATVGANQGWLRLLSSSGSNFIESALSNTTGSGAELSIANYNATQTFLLTGPNGTMVGAGVRQGVGTLNVQTGYYIGAVAGVNCAAGSFVAATAVVTKGLVTKCQ